LAALHRLGDMTKQAGLTSKSFWYALIGTAYVLIVLCLVDSSPETGVSVLKTIAVAALLTIFFAADFFIF